MACGHHLIIPDEPAQRFANGRLALSRGKRGMSVGPVVEKLIRLDFESSSKLLKGHQRRRSVTAFHPRNIGAQQPGSPFDIALRQPFGFAQRPQALANLH